MLELKTREKNKTMAVTKENMKENNNIAIAKLNNCPTSPRKMRIVADLVRGKSVDQALDIFRFSQKEASRKLEKLLLSAISNWQTKNKEANIEEANLYIHEIKVDSASMLKRIRTAPQGRAHRIRKRSNHVTIVLNTKDNTQSN
jgi:large subunit ribosomal protein L22|tara:strand:+ start:1205 stop:1636 length:432 start_codon:yes stop_codon:yes gene_type:complete